MNWNEEPYKTAYTSTGGNKKLAREVLVLTEWINEVVVTEYPPQSLRSIFNEW